MWTMLGLATSLAGPGFIAWAWQRKAATCATVAQDWPYLAAFAALLTGVAGIAVWCEGLGWRDLGFGHISASSLFSAILLTAFLMLAYGPAMSWSLKRLGSGKFEAGKETLANLPRWYLVLTVIVVAAGEEWLYRAYAIERLEALTGSLRIAAVASLVAFVVAHFPVWGIAASFAMLPAGVIFTLVYVWRRDITALILAHVATDLVGLLSIGTDKSPDNMDN